MEKTLSSILYPLSSILYPHILYPRSLCASGAKLNRESARSCNIERVGMQPLRRRHIVPIVPQAAVDLVHSPLALHKEADMKVAWIRDVGRLTGLHQRQHEPVVVRQEGHTGVPAHAPQPEISF